MEEKVCEKKGLIKGVERVKAYTSNSKNNDCQKTHFLFITLSIKRLNLLISLLPKLPPLS